MSPAAPVASFGDLALPGALLANLEALGYEQPTPIQAAAIPALLAGRDVLGQAQTGTGKTAAFALPTLARLQPQQAGVQTLILTPTRELAGQVCTALSEYSKGMSGVRVASLYGGTGFRDQLRALKQGTNVVVGTPGRVMDHLRRGTLDLKSLASLVLDEADEMLRMGFIDDVEWILQQTPPQRQVVLFSATMPSSIRAIARRHLKSPEEIAIAGRTATAAGVRQRYWPVAGASKTDALLRLLEVEEVDAAIVFVRTKQLSLELAESLERHGLRAAALNGDLPQAQREQTVERLKRNQLDILIATDVAARGLDVERISHVFNYDVPFDLEAYIHRIGRTGRAGRNGDAILFITHRERRMVHTIERHTGQKMEAMPLPTADAVNKARMQRFKQRLNNLLDSPHNAPFAEIVAELATERDIDPMIIAAAAAQMGNGGPLRLERDSPRSERQKSQRDRFDKNEGKPRSRRAGSNVEMQRFRLAVGRSHGVRPGNIVGAIANEAGLKSRSIGRIDIRDDHSLIDLPAGMPREVRQILQKVQVCGQALQIKPVS